MIFIFHRIFEEIFIFQRRLTKDPRATTRKVLTVAPGTKILQIYQHFDSNQIVNELKDIQSQFQAELLHYLKYIIRILIQVE